MHNEAFLDMDMFCDSVFFANARAPLLSPIK